MGKDEIVALDANKNNNINKMIWIMRIIAILLYQNVIMMTSPKRIKKTDEYGFTSYA
jgi:hypothetical protein